MQDTIAAIATAPGDAAISIVRISGSQTIEVTNRIFSSDVSSFTSHTAHYGKILSENGEVIDTVLLLIMRTPRSYTGEDSVEIFCHGGSIITKKVLERVLSAGARMAQPGEFSLRAFLNGKIDLAQAEAIQELIGAQNELALNAAEMQLEGALSKEIASFQNKLTDIAAILEAWVDFPEEDLAFAPMDEILLDLNSLTQKMEKLHHTFQEGKILKEGLTLCLAGLPNVGKSSLMNALLGKDRAIVTEIAGTTRDLLEEDLYLAGLHFRLIDTAGLRDTSEIVEKEGIRRSKLAMEKADLILFLLDASREISSEENELLSHLPKEKSLVIWNKVDIKSPKEKLSLEPVLLSAKERTGLEDLKTRIHSLIWKKGPPSKGEIVLTQARHKEALFSAIQFCKNVDLGLKSGASPEFLCIDIRQALESLSKIIGTNVTDDILSMI
ncbi:MAG TPA: tRNA uridine-5-carboxymethylaminomethyl(34) synthesis GTPase MnmE, partial [Chlamydiales bacterium]|nr:tRNA uridine-5-carboxymethylaminomethyl(34) synthesis GTPase MnmE [Chlamydiales bacterium]